MPATPAWPAPLLVGEVLQTLLAEGVTLESAFLDRIGDTDYLVYYMRARDLEHAYAVGAQLTVPIQQYHKQFKRETWRKVTPLECLIDIECPGTPSASDE